MADAQIPTPCTQCGRTLSEHWDFPDVCKEYDPAAPKPAAPAELPTSDEVMEVLVNETHSLKPVNSLRDLATAIQALYEPAIAAQAAEIERLTKERDACYAIVATTEKDQDGNAVEMPVPKHELMAHTIAVLEASGRSGAAQLAKAQAALREIAQHEDPRCGPPIANSMRRIALDALSDAAPNFAPPPSASDKEAGRALAELHPSVLLDETLDLVLKDDGMFFEKHDDVNYEMLNATGRRDLRERLRSVMRAAGVWDEVERAAHVWSNRICDERNSSQEAGR